MKKLLVLMMLIIGFFEFLIMYLLPLNLNSILGGPVIKVFFDSVFLFLFCVPAFFLVLNHIWPKINIESGINRSVIAFTALKAAAIVFVVESLIMFGLEYVGDDLTESSAIIIDLVTVTLVSTLLIKWFTINPLKLKLLRKDQRKNNFHVFYKLFFVYISVLILILLSLVLIHKQQVNRFAMQMSKTEALNISIIKNNFLNRLDNTIRDVLSLSLMHEIQEWNKTKSKFSTDRIKQDFLNLALVKPQFDQIRFIDKNGLEIVRVNQGENGPEAVDFFQLQNKKSRYYFIDTIKLNKGDIFISELDLNIENGMIERPIKPMIRIATVVTDSAENTIGMMIINLLGNQLLNEIENISQSMNGQVKLVNQEGFWLLGESNDKLWGFMYGDKKDYRFGLKKPNIWKTMKNKNAGIVYLEKGTYIFDSIFIDEHKMALNIMNKNKLKNVSPNVNRLIIYSFIPTKNVAIELIQERNILTLMYILVFLIGTIGFYIVYIAIVNRIKAEDRLIYSAHYDTLTTLANRSLFSDKLKSEITYNQHYKRPMVLFYMDLDKFKIVNDTYGHDVGDELLVQVSERLIDCFRKVDTVARLGGDEFAAIVHRVKKQKDIKSMAKRIIRLINEPFYLSAGTANIGITIGIAIIAHQNLDDEMDVIQVADKAMYQAKQDGRNCFRIIKIDKPE